MMDAPVILPFPKAIKCGETLIYVLWLLVVVPKHLWSPKVPHAVRPSFAVHKITNYIYAIAELAQHCKAAPPLGSGSLLVV